MKYTLPLPQGPIILNEEGGDDSYSDVYCYEYPLCLQQHDNATECRLPTPVPFIDANSRILPYILLLVRDLRPSP